MLQSILLGQADSGTAFICHFPAAAASENGAGGGGGAGVAAAAAAALSFAACSLLPQAVTRRIAEQTIAARDVAFMGPSGRVWATRWERRERLLSDDMGP